MEGNPFSAAMGSMISKNYPKEDAGSMSTIKVIAPRTQSEAQVESLEKSAAKHSNAMASNDDSRMSFTFMPSPIKEEDSGKGKCFKPSGRPSLLASSEPHELTNPFVFPSFSTNPHMLYANKLPGKFEGDPFANFDSSIPGPLSAIELANEKISQIIIEEFEPEIESPGEDCNVAAGIQTDIEASEKKAGVEEWKETGADGNQQDISAKISESSARASSDKSKRPPTSAKEPNLAHLRKLVSYFPECSVVRLQDNPILWTGQLQNFLKWAADSTSTVTIELSRLPFYAAHVVELDTSYLRNGTRKCCIHYFGLQELKLVGDDPDSRVLRYIPISLSKRMASRMHQVASLGMLHDGDEERWYEIAVLSLEKHDKSEFEEGVATAELFNGSKGMCSVQ